MIPPECGLIIALATAHLIGDFLLQSDQIVKAKSNPWVLIKHAGIIAVLSYLLAGCWSRWEIPMVIGLTHGLFDWMKERVQKQKTSFFLLDQALHALVIVATAIILSHSGCQGSWMLWMGRDWLRVLVLVSGLVASVSAGAVLIGLAVEPIRRQLNVSESVSYGSELNSRLIGQLERALILLFFLIGQPQSVGFLIGAKSIFRFGETRNHEDKNQTEYVLIGSLMSFGYGILIAAVTGRILQLL